MGKTIWACTAISVADIDKSTRFYCDALGFTERATTRPDGGAAGITARFVELDGQSIELVQMDSPPPPEVADQPLSRLGLVSHLAFNVEDMAATEAAIRVMGGTVVEQSRMSMVLDGIGPCTILYVRDPDGIWIELISMDEKARRRYAGLDS